MTMLPPDRPRDRAARSAATAGTRARNLEAGPSRRRALAVMAAAGWASAPRLGRTQPAADADAQAAQAAVRAFHDALRAGDEAAVQRLLAPDAVVLEGGHVETRAQYLREHLAADIAFARAVPSTVVATQVAVEGATAWVHAKTTTRGVFRERPVHLAGAELVVLTRGPAGWLIRAVHWSSHPVK